MVLPREHPILQWRAWWVASLLKRVAIQSHGRAVSEYATGHRMKTELSCFVEAVLWMANMHVGALNKYDSEWSDGAFLGASGIGIGVLIGTKDGIVKTTDYGTAEAGEVESSSVGA